MQKHKLNKKYSILSLYQNVGEIMARVSKQLCFPPKFFINVIFVPYFFSFLSALRSCLASSFNLLKIQYPLSPSSHPRQKNSGGKSTVFSMKNTKSNFRGLMCNSTSSFRVFIFRGFFLFLSPCHLFLGTASQRRVVF